MQQPGTGTADERSQLSEKAWVFAQRGVVLLVSMLAGVFIGYQMWGQAGERQIATPPEVGVIAAGGGNTCGCLLLVRQ